MFRIAAQRHLLEERGNYTTDGAKVAVIKRCEEPSVGNAHRRLDCIAFGDSKITLHIKLFFLIVYKLRECSIAD
jgi:hypothetical protein